MKKSTPPGRMGVPPLLFKSIAVMKLTILLIILSICQAQANVYGQGSITLNMQQTEISKVLHKIEQKGEFRFLYNYDLQSLKKKVSIRVENSPLSETLGILFANTDLTYRLLQNNLVVVISRDAGERNNVQVQGTVTDANNEPVSGVSVREKGTTNGTTTNATGHFALTVADNATLEFSSVGYQTQEIAVSGQTTINVKLVQSTVNLNEVVVVGYGTQQRKDVTSAISSVSTKDISSRPIVNTSEVLAGKAAGVQVFQPSGKPGSDFSVRVRGIASVLGSSQPIYVVDGVVTYDTKSLDPNNIESINILKDASAAGIYGSAGATNGVVMITTKKGSKGKTRVEVNAYTGFQKIVKTLDMLNSQQYADLLIDEKRNAGDPNFTVDPALLTTNTDWQDEVYRTAPMTGVNVGFSGGSDKGTYYFSLGYLNQDGIVKHSNFVRYSVKLNLEQNMNKWLTIGTHINYNRTNSRDVPDNSRVNQGGVVLGALSTPPVVKKYNADNTFGLNPFQAWENPLASIEGPVNKTIGNNLLGDVYGEVKLPLNLKFRTLFGVSLANYNYDYFLDPFRTQYGRSQEGIAENRNGETFRYIWDNTLTYAKTFGDHSVNAIIGSSASEEKIHSGRQYGEGFLNASIQTVNAATKNRQVSTTKEDWSLVSYFGRVNYTFNEKYLFTASVRADGSSRFGPNQRWGYFPAVSAGWRISDEAFMQSVSFVNDLKLRAGWGVTGNLPTDFYPTVSPIGTWPNYSFGNTFPGATPEGRIGNPDLKWEETKQFNIGFDLTFLNSRLTISADYYIKNTTDLIFQEFVPRSTGLDYRNANSEGVAQNKGFEFHISADAVSGRDFSWNPSLNMSFNKNRIKDLDSARTFFFGNIPERGDVIVLKEGLPLGAFWGYVAEGVDPNTGNMIFRDLNGDGNVDADNDRTFLGSALPKFTFGFVNDFTWRNLNLSILIDGVSGNKVFNATRIETEGMFDVKNSSAEVLRRWTKAGDQTDIPKAVFSDPDGNSRISSRFVENGSFVRLRNITLGYRLTSEKIRNFGVNSIRFYVTAQNLATFSDYKGYHPEVNRDGTNAISQGIDYGTYPQAKIFTFGLNLEL
jgi:TonB-dependent starch-binding outer membrane protein SusC